LMQSASTVTCANILYSMTTDSTVVLNLLFHPYQKPNQKQTR
jgi:hypothetical protein